MTESELSRIIFLFVSCFLLTTGGTNTLGRNKRSKGWGYTSQNGPGTWGGICQAGTKQSPINIQLGEAIVKNFPSFRFGNDYLKKQKFSAKNNGHTIYVALENETALPVIFGGGLGGNFVFEQLHFHWESEHEFEGKRADLEMHLVHYNSKYGSFAEAATKSDGLVVLAVLFNGGEETDDVIENFFECILDQVIRGGHVIHSPVEPLGNYLQDNDDLLTKESDRLFALRELLPKQTSRFFRYEGSLTTPGCDEVVQWTVFISRFPVSKKVLESVRSVPDHDNNVLVQNFRPPQNLNEREVYIQIKNDDETGDEYGQLNNSCNANGLLSLYLLCSCLFAYFKFNPSIHF